MLKASMIYISYSIFFKLLRYHMPCLIEKDQQKREANK